MMLRAVVASQKGRSSLLSKGNAQAKAVARGLFESAHEYAAQHFAHSSSGSCICLACLGCRCSACQAKTVCASEPQCVSFICHQESASDSSEEEADGDDEEEEAETDHHSSNPNPDSDCELNTEVSCFRFL